MNQFATANYLCFSSSFCRRYVNDVGVDFFWYCTELSVNKNVIIHTIKIPKGSFR